MLAPPLGRARGEPVSFLPLAMRGVTRREDALSGLRRTARTITPGGPGSPDPGESADAPRQLGAPRGIFRFRVHGQSDRPAVSSAAGRLPECRPGTWFMLNHARGCRIPPHPRDVSRGRPSVDGIRVTYGDIHRKSSEATRYEHFFGIHEVGAGFSGSPRAASGFVSWPSERASREPPCSLGCWFCSLGCWLSGVKPDITRTQERTLSSSRAVAARRH